MPPKRKTSLQPRKVPAEAAALIAEAEKQGWRVTSKRRGMMMYAPDGGGTASWHYTPGDMRRSVKILRTTLKRHGLVLPD